MTSEEELKRQNCQECNESTKFYRHPMDVPYFDWRGDLLFVEGTLSKLHTEHLLTHFTI